jgi:hypothetical protein
MGGMRTAALVALLSAAALGAQSNAPQLPKTFEEPMRLFTVGLGPFHRPISSKNAEAQAYFDQGIQMMFAFARTDAVRSFREAWKRDPDCAICYWGEAWAWGSYLNGPMPAQDSPHAWAAAQKALALKASAPEKERALIDAIAVRYVETFEPARRADQDRAYAQAMEQLAAR